MTNENIFSIKVGGAAGQGIKSAGQMLAKVASRSGYDIRTYTQFPSLIKGGHNVIQVMVSKVEVLAPVKKTDLIIAFNQETIEKHADELREGGGIMYDTARRIDIGKVKEGINLFPVPFTKLAKEAGNQELLDNTVAIGAAVALLGGNLEILSGIIKEEYGDKGETIVNMDEKAFESGHNYAKEHFQDKLLDILAPVENPQEKMVLNGSQAVAYGAIAGGIQFAAIYPMSPISNIIHTLAPYQQKYGFIYKQPEDELSAINMAIGAGYAGARSMVTTSGGGFALMSEGYGLAGITETPVVIIEGMRPGPGTGLPTWSGQGDLQFVLHAHQSEFPRIVLAAGDIKEAFYLTRDAFNLAEKYQTTALVLIDKNLCDDDQSYPIFDMGDYKVDRGKITRGYNENFARYYNEEDGISVRSIPGTGNFFIANSDEHDEIGFSSEEIEVANAQQEKRMRKLETCAREDMMKPEIFGPGDADVTIVSWGSNKGSILQALRDLPKVNFMHIVWMNPFPTEVVMDSLKKAKHVVDIECNITGQLANLIAEKTGIIIQDRLLKYDGRPIFPEEIIEKVKTVLESR